MMQEKDPFLCHCGPCKQYWRAAFPEKGSALFMPPVDRSAVTSMIFENVRHREDHPAILRIGDRVLVNGQLTGVVKYVGTLDDNLIAPGCYVGVHLDEQINSPHNGVYKGKRYFHCPRGHGAFVHYHQTIRINPPKKRPPVYGNSMYPAYHDLLHQRKQRSEMDPYMDWGPRDPRKQPIIHVFDSEDIAIQDQKKAERKARRLNLRSARSESENIQDVQTRQEMNKWKTYFGGDERAEKLAATLQKLRVAHELGKEHNAEQQTSEYGSESRAKRRWEQKRVSIKQ